MDANPMANFAEEEKPAEAKEKPAKKPTAKKDDK
jgi:hypothetical protein